MRRGVVIPLVALAAIAVAAALTLALWNDGMGDVAAAHQAESAPGAIPLAVLGDSNSQSYHDDQWFPPANGERGGTLRDRTFQWTEVMARLRGQELDLGPWVHWGRPGVVARAREWLGMSGGRAPQKWDYLYNFANSGASCKNIMGGRFRQAPRLVALMDQDPARWQRGVVVIAIGDNDYSGFLDLQARDPNAPELRQVIGYCAGEIGRAVALIHASHPSTRVLLVGLGNAADDPTNQDKLQSPEPLRNYRIALDAYNAAIRKVAADNPQTAYFDADRWQFDLFGTRNAEGKPVYKTVPLGPNLQLTYTMGDTPNNAVLADDHSGLAWNALWAQALVARMKEAFGLPLTPISDDEVIRFLDPLVAPPAKPPGS
jgi:hypothetical protein